MKFGMFLTGGGARGAYQVGAIKAINEISNKYKLNWPPKVLYGSSAGALNSSFLAMNYKEWDQGTRKLDKIWSEIEFNEILDLSISKMSFNSLKWLNQLAFGGFKKEYPLLSLIDTSPMKNFFLKHFNEDLLKKNIYEKNLDALAINALDYQTGETITFINSSHHFTAWNKNYRKSKIEEISINHLLASSAVPILFKPIELYPHEFFGDGCTRDICPISPLIKLGVTKSIIIDVNSDPITAIKDEKKTPSVVRITSLMIQTILVNLLTNDLERAELLNKLKNDENNLREFNFLKLVPSINISDLAYDFIDLIPKRLRYLILGLGTKHESSFLISYLLFTSSFTKKIIEIAYQDTLNKQNEIIEFLK